MSGKARSRLGALVVSLVSGLAYGGLVWSLLTLTSSVAQAQELPPVGSMPSPIDLAWGAFAVLVVNAVVLFARSLFPAQLAPEPSTLTSKRITRCLGLLVGIVTGLVGIAPITPVEPGMPGAVWVGRIASGVIVAAIAMFGRDLVVRGVWRRVKRPKAKPAPAEPPAP